MNPSDHLARPSHAVLDEPRMRRWRWWHVALTLVVLGMAWLAIVLYRVSTALPGHAVDYAQQILQLEESAQPESGEDAWPLLMRASDEVGAIYRRLVGGPPDQLPSVPIEALYLAKQPLDSNADGRLDAASRAYAEVMASGIPGLLDQIKGAQRCVRPKAAGLVLSEDLRIYYARSLAKVNRVRMFEAGRSGNEAELLRAFETNLALARHISRQTWIIDRLTANAILALTADEIAAQSLEREIPASTCSAVLILLDKYSDLPPPSFAFEGERLMVLDAIQATHSDDGAGSGVRLPLALEPQPSGIANVVGLYYARKTDVVAAVDKAYGEMQTLADAPRAQRKNLGLDPVGDVERLGSRYAILDLMMPAAEKAFQSNDQIQMHLGGLRCLLAIEIYRRMHGNTPPESLDALVSSSIAHLPLDPYASEGRFRYRVLDAPDEVGRRYLLYSVGADGVDNGGTPNNRDRFLALSPKGAGSDFILIEPRASK